MALGQTDLTDWVCNRETEEMTEDELVKKLHDMREYGRSLGRYETAMNVSW